jgi:hypothetical protein
MAIDLAKDIAAVARIDVVPTLLQVVCKVTRLGFAAVARVTDDRWIACAVHDEIAFGLAAGGELKVATTLCDQIRDTREPVIIDHVARDAIYREHPTPKMYGFESYISMPIILRNGEFFGTLCAIDPRPAALRSPEIEGMFRLFAELIAFHLDAQERLSRSDQALLDAHRGTELREQFIAVLGHDLRSPLSAISASAAVLQKSNLESKAANIAVLIRRSADRMAALISDVMDFARGRLGGGISVAALPRVQLVPVLEHLVAEVRASFPDRQIESDFNLTRAITCDAGRIAQLAANLLSNAVAHGNPSMPILVEARIVLNSLELSVSNEGPEIPEHIRKRLFEPFYRAAASRQEGLGLGLYIAAEIARAHGGTMGVDCEGGHTRFTLRMPVDGGR